MKLFLKSFFALVVVVMLAGCDQDGMNLGGGSSPSGSQEVGLLSLLSSGDDSDSGSGDELSLLGGGESDLPSGDGEQVARVHNPEPATMILWGIGLAGAAIAKRRKRV